jgi:hypothetical protein
MLAARGCKKTLEEAFEIAEKIDLATAYAEGLKGWQQGATSEADKRRGAGEPRGFVRTRMDGSGSRHGERSLP